MDSILNTCPEGLVALGMAAATLGYFMRNWDTPGKVAKTPSTGMDAIVGAVPIRVDALPVVARHDSNPPADGQPAIVGAGSNEDTLGDDNGGQLLVDPVMNIVVPVVTYMTAMQCLTSLLVSIPEAVIVSFDNPMIQAMHKIRVKFGILRDTVDWWAHAPAKLNEIRAKAAGHGIVKKNEVEYNQGDSALFAFRRMMMKIWQPIDVASDRRWMNRMVLSGGVYVCLEKVTMWKPARGGEGATYPIYQWRRMRTDTAWTLMYFLMIRGLMVTRGATETQAEYVACSAVIELVGVAYGQPSGLNWGYDASDFGFAVPDNLPTY